jgi:hypothetical protein
MRLRAFADKGRVIVEQQITTVTSVVQLFVSDALGSEFRVQSSGFRVQGSGFRVQGSEFKVQG